MAKRIIEPQVFRLDTYKNRYADNIRALGGFQMAIRRPLGHEIKGEALLSMDRYWRDAQWKYPKAWVERFFAELRRDKEWFAGVREIWALDNALVGNGLQMVTSWIAGQGTGTYTYPTKLEIGTSSQAVAKTDNGCVAALVSPAGMAIATATITRTTTTNTNDTFTAAKVSSPFDNTGGSTVTVTEAAVKNTDGTPKALCRAVATGKQVLNNEQLAVTYNLTVLTSAA